MSYLNNDLLAVNYLLTTATPVQDKHQVIHLQVTDVLVRRFDKPLRLSDAWSSIDAIAGYKGIRLDTFEEWTVWISKPHLVEEAEQARNQMRDRSKGGHIQSLVLSFKLNAELEGGHAVLPLASRWAGLAATVLPYTD